MSRDFDDRVKCDGAACPNFAAVRLDPAGKHYEILCCGRSLNVSHIDAIIAGKSAGRAI